MYFLWPHNLWWMLLLPLLPALYLWLLRRRKTTVLVYSSLRVVREAVRPTWRRHVPPALVWLAQPAQSLPLRQLLGCDQRIDYRRALARQQQLVRRRQAGRQGRCAGRTR